MGNLGSTLSSSSSQYHSIATCLRSGRHKPFRASAPSSSSPTHSRKNSLRLSRKNSSQSLTRPAMSESLPALALFPEQFPADQVLPSSSASIFAAAAAADDNALGNDAGQSRPASPSLVKKDFLDDFEAWEKWRDSKGFGLLHVAAGTEGHHDVVQLLMEVVPTLDVNLRASLGETPLHVACLKGFPLTVRMLMENQKTNAAATDAFGTTPLWYAAVNGHLEVVEELLRGARDGRDVGFNLRTNASGAMPNSSALEMARTREVKELLEEFASHFEARKSPHSHIQEAESGYWTPPKSMSPLSQSYSSSNESLTQGDALDSGSEPRELSVEYDFEVFNMSLVFPYDTLEELFEELAIQLRIPTMTGGVQYLHPRTGTFENLEHIHLLNSQPLISVLKVSAGNLRWWSWEMSPESQWVPWQQEHKKMYRTLVVKEGSVVRDEEALEKLQAVLKGSNVNLDLVKKAVAIENPDLFEEFENFREGLWSTRKSKAKATEIWQQKRDGAVRQRYVDHLDRLAESFPWNNNRDHPAVVPMFFPTLDSRLPQICQGGFAETEVHFSGPYGRGRYLTSSLQPEDTSLRVAKMSHPGCNVLEGEVLLVALVSPGSVYPVTEHPLGSGSMKGKPCSQGFTSHYTLSNRMDGIPISGPFNSQRDEDNLVIFNPAQVLPLFYLTF